MSLIENDPRNIGYAALIKAITWYKLIPPETARRIVTGSSQAKPGAKVTPEIRAQILRLTENPSFRTFNGIEKKFKINRFDIIGSEEVFTVGQIEKHLKQLKTIAETCPGDCSKCFLDREVTENLTMCEFLQDLDFENPQRPINSKVRKSAIKCDFTGETIKRGFQLYKQVDDYFEKYISSHKDIKIRDIVNMSLVEYMERHK